MQINKTTLIPFISGVCATGVLLGTFTVSCGVATGGAEPNSCRDGQLLLSDGMGGIKCKDLVELMGPKGDKGDPGDSVWTASENAINYDGDVGIGTSSPNSPLHISGVSTEDRVEILRGENVTNMNYQLSVYGKQHPSRASTVQLAAWNSEGRIAMVTDTREKVEAGTSTRGLFVANGNVGVGTIAPTQRLHVEGDILATGTVLEGSSRGGKRNVGDVSAADARRVLTALVPKRFRYKHSPHEEHLGFIAEDVPELVAMKDRKRLRTMDIVAVLTRVVQEQHKTIQKQQKRIVALELAAH